MARRYGSDDSSSSICFQHPFYESHIIAQYACTVIFLIVYLGMLVTLCVVRKRNGAGKHLIGLPYMFALFFMFIHQAIQFLFSTLQACDAITGVDGLNNWNIADIVFFGVHTFLLLFIVIWTLNIALRKQLGHGPLALRMAIIVDLFILGSLLATFVILTCYENWLSIQELLGNYSAYPENYRWMSSTYMQLTFWAIYLASILASGALSLVVVRSLKKDHLARGSLMFWVSILILSLFVYSLINIVQISVLLGYSRSFTLASFTAMFWISSFFRALAFIIIIVIAKSVTW